MKHCTPLRRLRPAAYLQNCGGAMRLALASVKQFAVALWKPMRSDAAQWPGSSTSEDWAGEPLRWLSSIAEAARSWAAQAGFSLPGPSAQGSWPLSLCSG